jgi:hypothetical protein
MADLEPRCRDGIRGWATRGEPLIQQRGFEHRNEPENPPAMMAAPQ